MVDRGSLRRCRLVGLAGAAGCAAAAVTAGRLGVSIGSRSPLLWSAVGLAGAAAIVGLWFVTLSAERLGRLVETWQAWLRSCAAVEARGEVGWAGRSLYLAAGLAGAINLTVVLRQPDDPADDDQGAYLLTAEQIDSAGGPLTLLRDLYSGNFEEANRHPLYLALLSLDPGIPWGRCVSCVAAVTAAVAGCGWLHRRYGVLPAGLFGVWTATNAAWLFFAARVYCEGVLLLTSLAAWILLAPLTDGADEAAGPGAGTAAGGDGQRSAGRQLWRGISAGGALGLTWLTKGTGLLLLAGSLAAIAWARLRSGATQRMIFQAACVGAGFVVIASPLLVRNGLRYGSLFYNVNSQLLFEDEFVDPVALAERRSVVEAAGEYWRTHSLRQIASRAVDGAVWEVYVALRGLGPAPLDDARILLGLPLAGCALVGLLGVPGFPRRLTLTWLLPLAAFFAWYTPIATGERFLAPLLLPLLMAAAVGLDRTARGLQRTSCGGERLLAAVGWIWGAVWTIATLWRG